MPPTALGGITVFRPLIEAVITADEITVDKFGPAFSVTIPIGESDDAQTALALVCEAKPSEHEGDEFYEFSFHYDLIPLAEAEPEHAPEIQELWTSQAVAPYKPPELKRVLLSQVCECYKALVTKIDKSPIYRVSYGVIDPENIPQRHEVLTNLLQGEGYEISEEGTDELGRQFWMMNVKV